MLLTGVAGLLIVAFDAQVTRLIQLYIIGVFVSFTLSQLGMVRHWQKERRRGTAPEGVRGRPAVNAAGAAATAIVLVIVLATKFVHGAWIVVVAMPVLFLLMKAVSRHYAAVREEHCLRVYMAQLRRKLEADPSRPRHLLTEAGMGYRFQP